MKRLAVLLVVIATCLFERNCFSQSISVYEYTPIEGLPSSEVYDVFQDSRGFLWFGSDNGVSRYDGTTFESFHIKDGLSDPVVFGFSEDSKGRIWFRTYSGKVSFYESGKISPYMHNGMLSQVCKGQIMSSLYCDKDDRLWFAAGPYLGSIAKNGDIDTTYAAFRTLIVTEVEGQQLSAFSGPTDPLTILQYKDKRISFRQSDTLHYYHVKCTELWNEQLIFSVNNNLFRVKDHQVQKIFTSNTPIISLHVDRENMLWVGYLNKGTERVDLRSGKSTESLFTDKSITKILHDHEGGFWFSTLESGVFYVPNLSVRTVAPLPPSKITAVLSRNGKITIGDISGNVIVFDARQQKVLWQTKFNQPIVTLYYSRAGNLWVSTTKETVRFDARLRAKTTIARSAAVIMENRPGSIIGFTGLKTSTFDSDGNLLSMVDLGWRVRAVYVDDSLIFVGGRSGFQTVDLDLNVIRSFPEFDDVKISHIKEINDTTLIIATNGSGYFLFNKKTRQHTQFSSSSGFNTDNIYAIDIGDSLLSIGTEKGIAVTSLSAQLKGSPDFRFITRQTGLPDGMVNFLTVIDDDLWAFTDQGISTIPLSGIQYAIKNPRFVLKRMTMNETNISRQSRTEFAHHENTLSIDYSLISFNNPNILTRYRVTPDDPWLYSNSRSILLSSLAPGNYKFELEYSADNISWEPAFEPFVFTITFPWWNRWYSYVTGLSLLLTFGYLYFKYLRSIYRQKNHYLQIINEHQQKLLQSEIVTLERERNRISKELHDRVGTNLTAIKLMVNQLLKWHKDPRVADVEEQFQIAIREIKEIIYGLTPPSLERYGLFTGLKNYIGKLNNSIPLNISLKTFGNEINKYDINIILFRVLQELITNSIKHSFAKNVSIHINSFEDILNIVYEDDGIGFSYDPLQSGLGLDSIESRINSLGGNLRFDSGEFGISYTIDIPVNQKKEPV